jgi:hypothetical protein
VAADPNAAQRAEPKLFDDRHVRSLRPLWALLDLVLDLRSGHVGRVAEDFVGGEIATGESLSGDAFERDIRKVLARGQKLETEEFLVE